MSDEATSISLARRSDAIQSALRLAARGRNVGAREAAQEFESMLVGEMLKNATEPLTEDSPLGSSPGARLYQELFLEEVVRQSGGRLGFASWIESHLEPATTDETTASAAAAPEDPR